MRIATTALCSTLMLMVSAPFAGAFDFGTRAEAVAMAKRVQAKIKKDGLDATYRAINGGAKEFHDRDLYPFVVELTGVVHANGATPAVIGKNLYDLKDQDGKFLTQDMIRIA